MLRALTLGVVVVVIGGGGGGGAVATAVIYHQSRCARQTCKKRRCHLTQTGCEQTGMLLGVGML